MTEWLPAYDVVTSTALSSAAFSRPRVWYASWQPRSVGAILEDQVADVGELELAVHLVRVVGVVDVCRQSSVSA
jgi:hypothetical protein